jgi:penicillin-binding protein 2
VAGKTGTAEFGEPIDAAGTRRSHAWFAAFAPYDDPSVVVVALIEGGTEQLEGSTYAVPAVERVLKAYFHVDEP